VAQEQDYSKYLRIFRVKVQGEISALRLLGILLADERAEAISDSL
jgi:hypothetical protein